MPFMYNIELSLFYYCLWCTNAIQKLKGSVKEPNKFHIYETEKITRKARRGRIYRAVRFLYPRYLYSNSQLSHIAIA